MLYLYYSNRQERLAQELSRLLSEPAGEDPLAPELVLVQNQGMAHWLTLELAERSGLAANIDFPLPAELAWKLFRRMHPALPERSQFDREVLLWRVMDLLGRLDAPEYEPLRRYLAGESPELRRLQLARRITDAFDQYLIYRPDWLLAWESGEGAVRDEHEAWQAALWRELAAGSEQPHRARLWRQFLELSDAELEAALADIPRRLAVFGISSLPPAYLDLLRRIAERRELHFFWLNPCREYWADIVSARSRDRFENYWRRQGKQGALELMEEGNALLASLGRLGRDALGLHWQRLIDESASDDHAEFVSPATTSCLGRIQHEILTLDAPETRPLLAASDDSITVHAAHSPMREVQALYDELLARFERDPTLSPRDVLVMSPDIEAYAPYIHAVFGAPEEDSRRIPYSIADRTLRAESELVRGFLALLECERGRFGAAEMFDLLQSEPVRERFGIGLEELPRIEHWLRETGIRWGLDGADRARHDLPESAEGTWEQGLSRLLLGYAMPLKERALFAGILPYDDIEGSDAETAGKLLAFHEALQRVGRELRVSRSVAEWRGVLEGWLARFFLARREDFDDEQLVRRALVELAEQAREAGFNEPLPAALIRDQLAGALAQSSRGGSFLVGQVTFAGMVPMRALPFRFIGLLGLGDTAYPRRRPPSGFDLISRHPRPGDRVHREEDRYLFLEALLSARETLYLSYVGRDVRDNSEAQPSVILAELIDYLIERYEVEGVEAEDEEGRREALMAHWVRRHPLQPFSPRYFDARERLRSHSRRQRAVAATLSGGAEPMPALFAQPLPEPEPALRELSLDSLIRFFAHPVRYLLGERLGVRLDAGESLPERELFELDALQASMLRSRLIEEARAGEDLASRLAVHQARGVLPAGQMGAHVYESLLVESESFVDRIQALGAEPAPPLSLDESLGSFRLRGSIEGITSGGRVGFRYARMTARDWSEFWIVHLALQLCAEGQPSIWLEREATRRLAPMSADAARAELTALLGWYWRGLTEPLPLLPRSSLAYAASLCETADHDEALEAARDEGWEAEKRPEAEDALMKIAFRGRSPLADPRFSELAEAFFCRAMRHPEDIA